MVPCPAPPIPVLGVPVVHEAALMRQLVSSIDHPVRTLAIVHNQDVTLGGPAVRRVLIELRSAFVEKVVLFSFPANLGVSAAWNALLSFHRDTTVLLANADGE
jgi:hypothetical protein